MEAAALRDELAAHAQIALEKGKCEIDALPCDDATPNHLVSATSSTARLPCTPMDIAAYFGCCNSTWRTRPTLAIWVPCARAGHFQHRRSIGDELLVPCASWCAWRVPAPPRSWSNECSTRASRMPTISSVPQQLLQDEERFPRLVVGQRDRTPLKRRYFLEASPESGDVTLGWNSAGLPAPWPYHLS